MASHSHNVFHENAAIDMYYFHDAIVFCLNIARNFVILYWTICFNVLLENLLVLDTPY